MCQKSFPCWHVICVFVFQPDRLASSRVLLVARRRKRLIWINNKATCAHMRSTFRGKAHRRGGANKNKKRAQPSPRNVAPKYWTSPRASAPFRTISATAITLSAHTARKPQNSVIIVYKIKQLQRLQRIMHQSQKHSLISEYRVRQLSGVQHKVPQNQLNSLILEYKMRRL